MQDPSNSAPRLPRRAFLLGVGGALAVAACGSSSDAPTADAGSGDAGARADAGSNPDGSACAGVCTALWIPPVLTGTTFTLTLAPSTKQLREGAATPTYGYNGNDFWGPTLIMNKGDTVQMNVTNRLTEETTTHWHGFHIPAVTDGGPHQPISAGGTWSPSFEVKNDAATYWYHPHMHELTHKQLNLGAGGFIIVRDPAEAALALPRTYGVDDIPLMLTSRTILPGSNAIDTATIYGDHLLANGIINASVGLPAQLVRFRVLNAEIERAYNLGFADDRRFYVIGTDGGLMSAPVAVTRLLMSPGERYEILVDLSADAVGSAVRMQSFNGDQPFGFPGGEPAQSGAFGSLLNNRTFDVLRINVTAALAGAVTRVPTTLIAHTPRTAADATVQRRIAITDMGPGTPFTFNGAGYSHLTINETVRLNAIEQWTIANGNTFGHSFHIHDVQFEIVSRSTGPVPEHEKGWKDTFYVRRNESVAFVARFDDFASTEHPFMYHCHMSNHEDEGLMGQFLVVP